MELVRLFVFAVGAGAADALLDRVRRGWSVAQSWPDEINGSPDDEVRRWIDRFRRQRMLLSGDRARQWLTGWRLEYADLVRFARRSVPPVPPTPPAARVPPAAGEGTDLRSPTPSALRSVLHGEAVLGGYLESHARALAQWVALDVGEEPGVDVRSADDRGEAHVFDVDDPLWREWSELLEIDASDLMESAMRCAKAGRAVARARSRLDTSDRVRGEVDTNVLAWTVFRLRSVRVTSVDVAKEIATAVRRERSLEELAGLAGAGIEAATVELGTAPRWWYGHLLGAQDGTVLGPLTVAGADGSGDESKRGAEMEVVVVDRRVVPSVDDPAIRKRAVDAMLDRHLAAQSEARVRWAPVMRGDS